MNTTFLLVNIVLAAVMVAFSHYTFTAFTGLPWPHSALYLVYGWLLVAALLSYKITVDKMRSKPAMFVNVFMLTSSLRMLISILIIVFMVLYFPLQGKYLSIYYVTGYLLFLIAEVLFLFNKSKTVR